MTTPTSYVGLLQFVMHMLPVPWPTPALSRGTHQKAYLKEAYLRPALGAGFGNDSWGQNCVEVWAEAALRPLCWCSALHLSTRRPIVGGPQNKSKKYLGRSYRTVCSLRASGHKAA